MYGRFCGWEFWVQFVDSWETFPYCQRKAGEYQLWVLNLYVCVNRKNDEPRASNKSH